VNFQQFLSWREQQLATQPDLIDGGETNLYRALASLSMPAPDAVERRIYRCDLARAWLSRYGYAEELSRQALVCRGVRHALALIFRDLKTHGDVLWLPGDVYPVYGELAQAAGITPIFYDSLPVPTLPSAAAASGEEVLLLANPWKPLGRYLTDDEITTLLQWLQASPQRHVIIDAVYDLDVPFHASTRALQHTGRAIVLHSITKGWLAPKTFGVALIGERHARLEAAFRDEPPSQEQLRLARHALSAAADKPGVVAQVLQARASRLLSQLPAGVRDALTLAPSHLATGCYFFAVGLPAEMLLREHRWLAIPASVFGARNWRGSIITSLAPAFAAPDQESAA
jgi:histidinol-phosphate/aromatic aminotransferase/cobyric acid decarboxylase-like protein